MKVILKIPQIILCCILMHTVIFASSIVESASKKFPETKIILKSITEEKEEQLRQLYLDKAAIEKEKDAVLKSMRSDIDENKNKWQSVQRDLQKDPDDQFLNKKRSLLTEMHDVLDDLLRTWENIPKKVNDAIIILEKYLKDIELKEYKKDLKLSAGPYFFEDLEDIYQKMTGQQKYVEQLKKRRDTLIKEQKSLSTLVEKQTENYQDKKNQLDEFSKTTADNQTATAPFGMSVQQRAEVLNLEGSLARLKKDLAQAQYKEKKYELSAIENELFVENLHLDILQDQQKIIKSSITVTAEQIEVAVQQLEKKKQAFSLLKTRYSDEISKLRRVREDEELKLRELSKKYSISLGNELDNWSWQPKKTLESYIGLSEVGLHNTYIRLIDDKENLFSTLISLEQEKINYAEEIVKIKETYFKVTIRKFASEDEITQEIKKYSDRQLAHENAIKNYKTKKDEIEAQLAKLQNEVPDRIKKRKADVAAQKETLFKNNIKEYAQCLSNLDKAEEYVSFRIDFINATSKAYSETITTLEKIVGYSKFILTELESITIWYRPEYAISWAGIHNIGNDGKLFFNDVRSYVSQFDLGIVWEKIKDVVKKPIDLLSFLLKIVLLLGLLIFLRFKSLSIIAFLNRIAQKKGEAEFLVWLRRVFALSLALIIGFVAKYAIAIFIWLAVFLALCQQTMPDPYLYIIFYLISIPYLILLAHKFIQYLIDYNKLCDYCLIPHDFHDRFIAVLSVFLYSTITLMLFREAFVLIKLKSELPTILLALNIIITQFCLIFLISKDLVLSVIPNRWEWLYKKINRYYYLIVFGLVLIIVMSNPYVGYGRLVLYLLLGVCYSILLLSFLVWGHSLVKKGASQLFFTSDQEVVRERFSYAKTWFGIAIVTSFIVFGFLGLMIGAKIWGWPIRFENINKWITDVPLLGIGEGTSSPLTLSRIGTILVFILMGFVFAYAFNRFVLEKVFDLMLVDSGVQSAIMNLIRYLFVAAAIVLGLNSVGYGGLITYLYVLILGIGYLIQNPLNDLVAYFIILMQRPIKIGDYIEIDEEIRGFVRKITPKSVMIRRKNSTTVIVPNNQIINKATVNWNYSRNFTAFDDIIVTISYKHDPLKVKDILLSVVDAHPNILKNPKPVIRLEAFRESGYEFMVRGFISSNLTMEKWEIASDVRLNLVKVLRENNIEMAIPMRIMISPEQASSGHSKTDKQ